jgi:hypothetical protein
MNNVTTKVVILRKVQVFKRMLILLLVIMILSMVGCSPEQAAPANEGFLSTQFVLKTTDTVEPTKTSLPSPTLQPTRTQVAVDVPAAVWISPAVPERLLTLMQWGADVTPTLDAETSDHQFVVLTDRETESTMQSTWLYVLAAPFPTLLDEVSLTDLQAAWRGEPPPLLMDRPILIEESTRLAFQSNWGPAAQSQVRTVAAEEILNQAWENQPALALIPFEALDPRWKVLRVDGWSPLDAGFVVDSYALALRFGLRGSTSFNIESNFFPKMNFDPGRMTVVMMTGVTALARSTALRMEEEGVLYPAGDIGPILRSADFTHISNEVPFFDGCPPAKPLRAGMRFCSDPRYLELLLAVGTDVVELTGNHLMDWGAEGLTFTLDLYQEYDLAYFGGGYNLEDARKPLLIEHNGNRLAFLGCNAIGPQAVFALVDAPGAAECDREWMAAAIQDLRDQGYLPVVTFQSLELDDVKPHSMQRADFRQMSEAGAVIVSGSQAHIPQAMAFNKDRLIHYGLGNLFFDQMEPWQRPQFIDRHVFYDGRYINTELITTMLEDSARPRLMTPAEREAFLQRIFEASGW